MADSVRHYMPKPTTLQKYHAEIERLVYAAERVCDDMACADFGLCCNRDCPFAPKTDAEKEAQICALVLLRDALGDPVEQHDTEENR